MDFYLVYFEMGWLWLAHHLKEENQQRPVRQEGPVPLSQERWQAASVQSQDAAAEAGWQQETILSW